MKMTSGCSLLLRKSKASSAEPAILTFMSRLSSSLLSANLATLESSTRRAFLIAILLPQAVTSIALVIGLVLLLQLPAFQFRALCRPVAFVPITNAGLCRAGGENFTGRGGQANLAIGFTVAKSRLDGAAIRVAQQAVSVKLAVYILAFVFLTVGENFRAAAVENSVGKAALIVAAIRVG